MRVKTILSKDAVPDMIIADDVLSFSGQLIIPKGTVLTNRSITRLKFYSIPNIKVLVEESEDIDEQEAASQGQAAGRQEQKPVYRTFSDSIRQSPEYKEFNKNVVESAKVLQDSLSSFITRENDDINTNMLLNQTKDTIAASRNPLHTFHMLQSMRDYDDATFIHSLNVSIICNAFGTWLGLSQKENDILTLAGLLHDVGKLKIPDTIIKKPGSLTEAEFAMVKLHPRRGYAILKNLPVDPRIRNAALMHHERCDGSGYPSGLKADQIDDMAKIIAIADIYDAMTSARVYRGPLCPFDVISVFENEGYQRFDPHYQMVFLNNIVDSYVNNTVRLTDGREGEIVMINQNKLSKPIVRVGDEFVDLSKKENHHIGVEAIL